jgi:hypothetical protein
MTNESLTASAAALRPPARTIRTETRANASLVESTTNASVPETVASARAHEVAELQARQAVTWSQDTR